MTVATGGVSINPSGRSVKLTQVPIDQPALLLKQPGAAVVVVELVVVEAVDLFFLPLQPTVVYS
jgi:hypothetical protein